MNGERQAFQPICQSKAIASFSGAVKHYMKRYGCTQAELAKKGNLSKTTVSRICRNSNDKGSTYQPTPNAVIAVSIALGLNEEEIQALVYAAFPEWEIWHQAIKRHLNIYETNALLYENGLPLLGSNEE